MRIALLFLALFSLPCAAQVQSADPDQPYLDFTAAYDRLDATAVSRLYTQDAYLLNLYVGSPTTSLAGTAAIMEYFGEFFEMVRSNGQHLRLTFKIADRKREGEGYLDNGYYRLEFVTEDAPPYVSYGKFSTVLAAGADGWKFRVDATTDAEAAEYAAATVPEIPTRE